MLEETNLVTLNLSDENLCNRYVSTTMNVYAYGYINLSANSRCKTI